MENHRKVQKWKKHEKVRRKKTYKTKERKEFPWKNEVNEKTE